MKELIAFCGGMGSGKDTIGKLVATGSDRKQILHLSFAQPLKEEVNLLVGMIKDGYTEEEICNNLDITKDELSACMEILNGTLPHATDRTSEARQLLQFFGTDIRRKKDENYWVNKTRETIEKYFNKYDDILIFVTDGRFPNEFDLIKELGGKLYLLWVTEDERCERVKLRDGKYPTTHALNHPSETMWDKYPKEKYDLIIMGDDMTIEEEVKLVTEHMAGLLETV